MVLVIESCLGMAASKAQIMSVSVSLQRRNSCKTLTLGAHESVLYWHSPAVCAAAAALHSAGSWLNGSLPGRNLERESEGEPTSGVGVGSL